MVKHLDSSLDATFAALSDPTRRGILAQLALDETSVSDLAAPYRMSLPAVSKHLRVLEHAGLVARRKNGRVHRCRLLAEPMRDAAKWIEHYRNFWESQFDALEKFLEATAPPAASEVSTAASENSLPPISAHSKRSELRKRKPRRGE